MEDDRIDRMDDLSEDALVLAVLFMYLPGKMQEEIIQIMKGDTE